MTIHVICLDGTSQEKNQQHPTNIAKLFDAVGGAATPADFGSFESANGPLKAKYLPGVGTQGAPMLKTLGALFGDGLAELIVRGYTYVSRSWQAGDEIVISGFSRGATAARALAGLISARGLLNPARYRNPADKNEAYERAVAAWYLYRDGDASLVNPTRPDAIEAMIGHPLPKLTAADFQAVPPIKAVAVFDTVSSLGVPHLSLHGQVVFDFSICNTTLSDNVEYGFHALAADETRELFSPTFWAQRKNVVQTIFPGCHSNVGGGFPDSVLSDQVLKWMQDQLQGIGVQLKPPASNGQWDGLIEDDGRKPPFFGLLCRGRAFPPYAQPHPSIKQRLGLKGRVTPFLPDPYKPAGVYVGGTPLV